MVHFPVSHMLPLPNQEARFSCDLGFGFEPGKAKSRSLMVEEVKEREFRLSAPGKRSLAALAGPKVHLNRLPSQSGFNVRSLVSITDNKGLFLLSSLCLSKSFPSLIM